jgi:penicillin-binding protein 1A
MVAADGAPLARYGDLAGDPVDVRDLPPHLVHAVMAIEDRRFYSHFGIDPIGILRAFVANVRAGRTVQGGSTITQQLAKNLFLTPERTLRRKVQELLLALWLEANYSKDEILSAYLNRVYLGAGTYGVDAAARTYFGTPARSVTLHQAAILAGLLRAPSRYSPARAPELAEARAETVLAAMVDAGFIDESAAEAADMVPPLPRRRPGTGNDGRYFADWAADQVPDFVGYEAVDLRVVTTLEPELQRRVEAIVADHLAAAAGDDVDQAAVVVMRPDGAVVAMVGGRSYAESQFNRATQARRQPGSAFKPIVFLAALERGLAPYDRVLDAPIDVGGWSPDNFSGRYAGEITATEALARSANSAAVRVLEHAGIDNTIALARRLGLSGELRRDLSLALGTSEVTLLELTGAYAAFLNNGDAVWPWAVSRIEDNDGAVVYRRSGSGAGEATRPRHAWELTRMLEAVIDDGTGRAAAPDRPAAGKTGTSQDYRDAWFVGFTVDYVAGVWVGNDDSAPMRRVTGGGLPARIWRDVMVAAHRGRPARPLPGPLNLDLTPPEPPRVDRDEPLDDRALEDLLQRVTGNDR